MSSARMKSLVFKESGRAIVSTDMRAAKAHVRHAYKMWQRNVPVIWHKYKFYTMPVPEFRALIKDQFVKNANVQDPRVVDRLVVKAERDLHATLVHWHNPDHMRNVLTKENLTAKPADFLSQFLAGKD